HARQDTPAHRVEEVHCQLPVVGRVLDAEQHRLAGDQLALVEEEAAAVRLVVQYAAVDLLAAGHAVRQEGDGERATLGRRGAVDREQMHLVQPRRCRQPDFGGGEACQVGGDRLEQRPGDAVKHVDLDHLPTGPGVPRDVDVAMVDGPGNLDV